MILTNRFQAPYLTLRHSTWLQIFVHKFNDTELKNSRKIKHVSLSRCCCLDLSRNRRLKTASVCKYNILCGPPCTHVKNPIMFSRWS